MKKLLAIVLTLSMVLGMASFAFAEEQQIPLVAAYSPFSEKFSPYYADTAYDKDATDLTQVSILTTDRMGGIIHNAIEGETVNYNGTDYLYTGIANTSVEYDEAADITTYTAKLKEGLKFSDGDDLTADDIIFTYYVYLDPDYVGSTTINSYPIIGLQDYQTQTSSEVYEKYAALVDEFFTLGRDAEVKADSNFTQEQFDAFWALEKSTWMNSVQKIVDYVNTNYLSYAPERIGVEADKVGDKEKVALGMALWGFGAYDAETGKFTTKSGKEFDLKNGNYPVLEDYYDETFAAYEGNIGNFWTTENTDKTDAVKAVKDAYIAEWGPKDETMAGKGVPNISGIKKLDDLTVEIKTTGYSAPAVYSILGAYVTPLHYYGDAAQYDYENNKFGHPFGDLSAQESNSKQPLGAGPYKFIKYENRIVYYEANENYYKGEPKTKFLQLKETQASEVAAGVQTGTVDTGELTGSKANFEMVANYNSNSEINGDVISLGLVDNLGYGYFGINADTVKVGENKASEESKALRKGLATVIAYYRKITFDSYYGEAARVIEYPISNTSWAAPQPTDEGYEVAFSKDADGNDLFLAENTFEQNEEAALQGAISWFKAAGYTFDEATGKFTAAPEGAKLSYEIIIPGDGIGDHPSFAVLTYSKATLEKIGIELKINDPTDANILWNALDAGTQELWCAAWGSTIDPDMYQVYHSSNIVGKGGSDSNHYRIEDPTLDQAILDARKSDDQTYRKATYKQALDIIMDWAVEVPAYQRKNATIFSVQRINMDTITPDMTTYWGWMAQINEILMK